MKLIAVTRIVRKTGDVLPGEPFDESNAKEADWLVKNGAASVAPADPALVAPTKAAKPVVG